MKSTDHSHTTLLHSTAYMTVAVSRRCRRTASASTISPGISHTRWCTQVIGLTTHHRDHAQGRERRVGEPVLAARADVVVEVPAAEPVVHSSVVDADVELSPLARNHRQDNGFDRGRRGEPGPIFAFSVQILTRHGRRLKA